MRICIFGAGAVGSHFAVRLAQSGHEVSCVMRGPHLAAMESTLTRHLSIRPKAAHDGEKRHEQQQDADGGFNFDTRGGESDADDTGAVLIFDEVVTSRLHWGGFQGVYDIKPDMTTIGKYFGGGFSFGGFGGKEEMGE